jgi:quercetin dioxygenase-like cupin family protein
MKKSMHVVRKEDLPLIGISYNFVGADQGDVAISMFLVEAPPGQGAPLHVHEYDEIVLVQEGRSRFVIGDAIREAGPGEILVVKARTPHGFINAGFGSSQADRYTSEPAIPAGTCRSNRDVPPGGSS